MQETENLIKWIKNTKGITEIHIHDLADYLPEYEKHLIELDKINAEITKLEKRKDVIKYQRKITTSLATVIEYDQEMNGINEELKVLKNKLKNKK
jgi:hypothetical protein